MKTRRRQVELRPLVPGFLKIIPRLPAMVCKKEILFKIFTPVTCIFRGIKNLFKRKPSLRMIRQAAMETKNQCLVGQTNGFQDCNVQRMSSVSLTPERLQERNVVAEMFNWKDPSRGKRKCHSCQEDRPAFHTCRMCLKLYSTLPPSSCRKCQKEKPLVNLCMKYHEKQPVIYFRDEEKNVALYTSFLDELRKLQRRPASNICNGKTHQINNCPTCLSFWPTAGDCTCPQCTLTPPVVKVLSARSRKTMMIDVCPCVLCFKKHLKLKVCSTCKNQKRADPTEETSFYVLLP